MNIRFEARVIVDESLSMPINGNSRYHKNKKDAVREADDHNAESGSKCIVVKVSRELVHKTD